MGEKGEIEGGRDGGRERWREGEIEGERDGGRKEIRPEPIMLKSGLVFFLEIPNNSFPAFSLYSMHHASTFLLCGSSDDFGQHKRFRRLLVVAELLEL